MSGSAICRDMRSMNAALLSCFKCGLDDERCGGSCGVVYRVFFLFLFAAEPCCSFCGLEDQKSSDSRGFVLMRRGTLTLVQAQCVHIPQKHDEYF